VNPVEPADSTIDASLRWSLIGFKAIFFFAFGGVGLGLLIWTFRAPAEKDLSAPRYRDAPWLANDDWQTADIRSSSRQSMWFAWGFTGLWNLISAPLPFVVVEEVVHRHNSLALIGLLFPLIGLALLVWAIRRTREWRRFGAAPVTLDPFPGSIGGHVGGTIDVGVPFDPGARFSVTLTSLHSYETGSGDNRSRRESARWQDTQLAQAVAGPAGTRLRFRFDVPKDQQPSDAAKRGDSWNLWRLNLNAALPGVDIDRDYEIPVYPTGARSRHLSDLSVESARTAQQTADLEAIRNQVRLTRGVTGKSMLYPMGRGLTQSFIGSIFGAIFAAAGWFLLTRESAVVIGSVFGLLGLLILFSSLYVVLNSLEVVQEGIELRTVRRVLGIPVRTRSIRQSDITHFSKHSSMSTQSGGKHVLYYAVYAHGRQGTKLTVGEGFEGTRQADAAIQFIAREFGIAAGSDAGPVEPGYPDYNMLAAD